MAGKAEAKDQEHESKQSEALSVATQGEALFAPSAAGQALADVLVARLSHLNASQLLADAAACGAAVKAAFDQLEKADTHDNDDGK
ncbi:hypothetical protein PS870_06431 [Pseudomonas fluorescens]|uniref:Uncharacterized protein n=1 Tax=Pseudomonas fluorescens TaxID=294 RepID=A0A5E7QJT1_PSEFL|nr:hypothetical protein [Pseudomonas fluorescens]VVP61745.1 hypothetical protein PS870_06431 [Pseudomonas fluorescens]